MSDPIATVRKFIEEMINGNDLEGIVGMVADDIYYQNMPLAAANGKEAFIDFVKDMGEIQDMTLTIRNIAANDKVVFTERSDSWTMNGEQVVEPFVGVFEVTDDGKISRWCDYFDLRSWELSGQHPREFFVKWAREDYRHLYQ